MFESKIKSVIESSIEVKKNIVNDEALIHKIELVVTACILAFKNNRKILFCGNGGSAADAQHLAAEFSGRYYKDRPPLYAEALHVNTSYLTAVSNDYGFDHVYSRMVLAMGAPGDILFGLSTSGNSTNIIRAFETAKEREMICIGMTGQSGGKLIALSDILINVPSQDTPRIQESHITIGHIICEIVERNIFPE